ncbi:MAG: hypothetical protein LBQ60_20425 [Bacteroidales bacterium]|jgi:hypothetical protein|nr:hypothetical protein [Bacteroidales bacterium]
MGSNTSQWLCRLKIRKFFFLIIFLSITSLYVKAGNNDHAIKPGQQEMFDQLREWCDKLLSCQLHHEDHALDGGIVCPGCALMHGRAPDAIYPLLYLADHTKDQRYVEAAKKLFDWGEANVRFADGTWNNEVSIYTWRGVTVFGLIVLLESISDFGHLIDEPTKKRWLESASEQVKYVSSAMKPGFGNINYPATACYALALSGKMLGKEEYIEQAARQAKDILAYFTENNHFFFGEGPYPYNKSKKGLLPVDLGYNVEETLPNLMLYADLVKDDVLKEAIKKSMYTHLEFMLGDGAWDNSWGTRNYKWSYWGSRTCDGVISLCSVLGKDDPLFIEAGYRNFELLRACTGNGILYGGMHYQSAGYAACIHHTFEHAKGLAVALHKGFSRPAERISLPREKEYGVRHFEDLDVWTVALGGWRGTISGYDVAYKSPGGNTHGGALSMLWNPKTGPILAAAMTEYSMVESSNMQVSKRLMNYPSTLRVEYKEKGKTYTNICDKEARISHDSGTDGEKFVVLTELVAKDGKSPESGSIPVEITYQFTKTDIHIKAVSLNQKDKEMTLAVPVISKGNEKYASVRNGFYIEKPDTRLYIIVGSAMKIMPTEVNQRAFNLVPGFEFIPFYVPFKDEVTVKMTIAE